MTQNKLTRYDRRPVEGEDPSRQLRIQSRHKTMWVTRELIEDFAARPECGPARAIFEMMLELFEER